jgi:hypothetical protein
MKYVLRKLAVPPAIAAITEFKIISLAPENFAENPAKAFLRTSAILTDDPTAAEYPYARSLVLYVLDEFLFP